MSKKERVFIEDPNEPIDGTTMEERLKKYEKQKLEYAAQREEEWLNEPSTFDKFMAGIKKIAAKLSKKKTAQMQSTRKHR